MEEKLQTRRQAVSMIPAQQVLIADNDSEQTWILGSALIRAGYRVATCADGAEAIELLEAGTSDVLITELQMPRVSGLRLLQWVREHRPGLPVVVVTGVGPAALHEIGPLQDVLGVIHKPAVPQECIDVLNRREHTAPTLPKAEGSVDVLLRTLQEAVTSEQGGEVAVRSHDQVGHVFVVNGKFAWAFVTGEPTNLLSDLVERADLDPEDLKAAFAECKASGKNFAETIIRWGLIDRGRIRALLLERIARCVAHMSHWPDLRTMFIPKQRAYGGDLLYGIDEVLAAVQQAEATRRQESPAQAPNVAAQRA